MAAMRVFRWVIVVVAALLPLATLVYRNDVGRWERNHSAMAAPDEFSYLLIADNLLHGAGISTQATLGRDTFYPPGYPLLLAGVCKVFGLTVFHAHVLNAVLLSLATVMVFLLARHLLNMLADGERARFHSSTDATEWLAVLITALFASNWHVLEGALYVFSEPAFMVVTFAWLALGLRWRAWYLHPEQTFFLALLAVVAWSLRGAGIVCVGTMGVFALLHIRRRGFFKPATAVVIVAILAMLYQLGIAWASPEKSLAAGGNTDNSYVHQLLHGITQNDTLHFSNPRQWPALAARLGDLVFGHLNDYAGSFIPWFREAPDYLFLNVIGKTLGILGLLGWLNRLLRRNSSTHFLELYVLFYVALYLVWPFNMIRFWAPLLPLMLVYAVDGLRQFSRWEGWRVGKKQVSASAAAMLLLTLLLGLHVEELTHQLRNYQRRLNYVSDALAAAAATVVRLSPDPTRTVLVVAGSDEHFLYAWYLAQAGTKGDRYLPASPEPHGAGGGSRRETIEELLTRSLTAAAENPQKQVFVMSYFREPSYRAIFEDLGRSNPALLNRFRREVVFEKEILVTVWKFTLRKS